MKYQLETHAVIFLCGEYFALHLTHDFTAYIETKPIAFLIRSVAFSEKAVKQMGHRTFTTPLLSTSVATIFVIALDNKTF